MYQFSPLKYIFLFARRSTIREFNFSNIVWKNVVDNRNIFDNIRILLYQVTIYICTLLYISSKLFVCDRLALFYGVSRFSPQLVSLSLFPIVLSQPQREDWTSPWIEHTHNSHNNIDSKIWTEPCETWSQVSLGIFFRYTRTEVYILAFDNEEFRDCIYLQFAFISFSTKRLI